MKYEISPISFQNMRWDIPGRIKSRTKFPAYLLLISASSSFIALVLFFSFWFVFSRDKELANKSLEFIALLVFSILFAFGSYCAMPSLIELLIQAFKTKRKNNLNRMYEIKLFSLTIFLLVFLFFPFTPILLIYIWTYFNDTKLKYPSIHIDDKKPIVSVKNLVLSFKVPGVKRRKIVIRDVTFRLYNGEVMAIVGESGSGKSVLTSTLFGLSGKNSYVEKGTIEILGNNVTNWSQSKWERSGLRGNIISAVFQNPMTTLNPTQSIGLQIMEGLFVNNIAKTRRQAKKVAIGYLKKTRIANPEKVFNMYPHELSGGMKQRAVLSAILACKSRIIVLDEPTTALDPTVQAQVLEIIKELKNEFNLSIIFITHDLGVVASLADRIAIMYAGKIIEEGPTKEVMLHSQHPYTWGLILSMPDVNKSSTLESIPGSVPLNLNDIVGDAFAPRNRYALGIDYQKHPKVFKVSNTNHYCASWLLSPKAPKYDPPKKIMQRWNRWAKMNENYKPSTRLKSYIFDSSTRQYVHVNSNNPGKEVKN